MNRARPGWVWRGLHLRRLTFALYVVGWPLAGLACAQFPNNDGNREAVAIVRAAAADQATLPAAKAVDSQAMPVLPAVEPQPPAPAPLLLSLDTVFRLAEGQNPKIAVARERVREACAAKDAAASRWLPDIYAGTAYYRHEGGIQNEDGTLTHSSTGAFFAGLEIDSKLDLRDYAFQQVNARRQLWQQKGELSKITNETLLEAANTYIDLLTARTGAAITDDLEKNIRELYDRAVQVSKTEPSLAIEVSRLRTVLDSLKQNSQGLHIQAAAASAKLIYLLGVDPCTELVLIDRRLTMLNLADATLPTCSLVAQVLAHGPGIQEMEGLLALIQESIAKSQGPSQYLPIFEVRMAEGVFGAGPGDSSDWDNRWDLGLQVRWNLTEYITAHDRSRVAQSKAQQAHLAYQELRAKLTAGVQEAQSSILNGQELLRLGTAHIDSACQLYQLSVRRLKDLPGMEPRLYSEALQSLDALGRAKMNYLTALSNYDKAQIRLTVLLGGCGDK
jgi:outer membrane protein TolC